MYHSNNSHGPQMGVDNDSAFFQSVFSFMDTDDSQGCKGREKNILIIIAYFLAIHAIPRLLYDEIRETPEISI